MTSSKNSIVVVHRSVGALLLLLILILAGVTGVSQIKTVGSPDELAIRQALADQPDYTAVQQFTFIEPIGGFGGTSKVAKLGRRFRGMNEDTIFITEAGKPTIKIYPKRREFAEIPPDKEEAAEDKDSAVTPEDLARREDVIFRPVGIETIGHHKCRKIEAAYKDPRLKDLRFIYCLAPELHNLAIFAQTVAGPVTMTTTLSDVSLAVSEELFRVPRDYKKIEEKSPAEQTKELLDRIKRATPPKPIP